MQKGMSRKNIDSYKVLCGYCPDEKCKTRLFFPAYDKSIECPGMRSEARPGDDSERGRGHEPRRGPAQHTEEQTTGVREAEERRRQCKGPGAV